MSRLYWSNLPDPNRPRGGTSTLCSSFTTDDLPMPEYPDTSTSSGVPLVTTRSKAPSSVSISRAPIQFFGNDEPVDRVVFGQCERVDPSFGVRLREAPPQV